MCVCTRAAAGEGGGAGERAGEGGGEEDEEEGGRVQEHAEAGHATAGARLHLGGGECPAGLSSARLSSAKDPWIQHHHWEPVCLWTLQP